MNDVVTCPTERDGNDEVARVWASGLLPPAAADEFEAHLLTCARCQDAVQHAPRFTVALRAAATAHRVRQDRMTRLRWAMVAGAAAAAAAAAYLVTSRS